MKKNKNKNFKKWNQLEEEKKWNKQNILERAPKKWVKKVEKSVFIVASVSNPLLQLDSKHPLLLQVCVILPIWTNIAYRL